MSWDLARAFASTKREHGSLPEDMQRALDEAMSRLLAPKDFVLYERHDPAMIAQLVGKDGERYIIVDVRTSEETWVGAESLLQYGKPIDEWFRGGFLKDHKNLFLPLYFSTTFDELVAQWEKVDRKLERKGTRWRLVSELRRAWVPRWGRWSEREVMDVIQHNAIEPHAIISWDTTTSPRRVLLVHATSLIPTVGTIQTP